MPIAFAILAAALCGAIVGCGGGGPKQFAAKETFNVTGTVTLNGTPLANGEIFFVSKDDPDYMVGGVTNGNGEFDVAAVAAGAYQVRFSRQTGAAEPDPKMDAKYGETSPLEADVSASSTEFTFDLTMD